MEKLVITISKYCDNGIILKYNSDDFHVDNFSYDGYADLLADIVNCSFTEYGWKYVRIKQRNEPFFFKCKCSESIEITPDDTLIYLNIEYYG